MDKAQETAKKLMESMLKAAANDVKGEGYVSDSFAEGHAMALFFAAKRVAGDFGLPFEWESMGDWAETVRK